MSAADPHALRRPSHGDFHPTMLANGGLVLRDLIALRQIGIEVVFTGKPVLSTDRTVQGKTGANGHLDRGFVDHRQAAGKSQAYRARLAVGRTPECRAAAAEHLGFRSQLGVDFDADNDFVHHRLSVLYVRSRSFFIASRPASNASRRTDFLASTYSLPSLTASSNFWPASLAASRNVCSALRA